MKRDMDLIRYILIAAENASEQLELADVLEYGCSKEKAAYHVELMKAHKLINANVKYALGDIPVMLTVESITWEGYDYLDAIRSETVWKKAKEAIRDTVGEASLSVTKQVCSTLATATIKAHLGI